MFFSCSLCGNTPTKTEDIISDIAETVVEKLGKGARSGFHSFTHTAALLERTLPFVTELAIPATTHEALIRKFPRFVVGNYGSPCPTQVDPAKRDLHEFAS